MKKILLLHGWNYLNYKNVSSDPSESPWRNRQTFIDLLQSQGFELIIPAFPGFIGYLHKDPSNTWDINDYVNYCNELVKKFEPNVIIGYSFGGAIATLWKSSIGVNSEIKIILISPALERQYKKNTFNSVFGLKILIPNFLANIVRDLYLKFIAKNPYYSKGTIFLKRSYLNIVKLRSGNELLKINPEQMLLVFGSNDTATPPELLSKLFSNNQKILDKIVVISGGGHDIANTHTVELVETIKKFI